eukprot:CAMPEP_0202477342 /NCGR_PEP_ID=MMETSP1360-20130828/93894_1 /ASSEMBLY_ACC=CAM_ASM_000848 /TAXON_ID=515479 /ORGANISM="Licmophora paradoxa, Strain CCMP2313" /LENGTH=38 /DNA_ID= /DNA_START= /DNA_END= /DNA_ORIENTATION=
MTEFSGPMNLLFDNFNSVTSDLDGNAGMMPSNEFSDKW